MNIVMRALIYALYLDLYQYPQNYYQIQKILELLLDSLNYHLMYQGEVREFSESDSNSEDTDINQDITHKLMLSLQYSF